MNLKPGDHVIGWRNDEPLELRMVKAVNSRGFEVETGSYRAIKVRANGVPYTPGFCRRYDTEPTTIEAFDGIRRRWLLTNIQRILDDATLSPRALERALNVLREYR